MSPLTRRPSRSERKAKPKIEGDFSAARIVCEEAVCHVVDGILAQVQRDWHGNSAKSRENTHG